MARHQVKKTDQPWPNTTLVCYLTISVSLAEPYNGTTSQRTWNLRRHSPQNSISVFSLPRGCASCSSPAAHCSQYLPTTTHSFFGAASSSSPVVRQNTETKTLTISVSLAVNQRGSPEGNKFWRRYAAFYEAQLRYGPPLDEAFLEVLNL